MIRTVILLGETKPTYAPGGAPSAVSTPRKKRRRTIFTRSRSRRRRRRRRRRRKKNDETFLMRASLWCICSDWISSLAQPAAHSQHGAGSPNTAAAEPRNQRDQSCTSDPGGMGRGEGYVCIGGLHLGWIDADRSERSVIILYFLDHTPLHRCKWEVKNRQLFFRKPRFLAAKFINDFD